MTESKNGSKYVMLPILPSTKDRLDNLMPKAWTYDRCIDNLCEIWEKERKSTGKQPKDNQTS